MRLIDADALLEKIKLDYNLDYGETLIDPRDFADAVYDVPTVDAVPVVRCRNCKHYGYDALGYTVCHAAVGLVYPEDDSYCSYGQRKEQFAGVGKMDGGENGTNH